MSATLGLILLGTPLVPGQLPPMTSPPVVRGVPSAFPPGVPIDRAALAPAGFVHVKVVPPKGSSVTFLPNLPDSFTQATPAPVGLRPGYSYRLALSDLPDRPRDAVLFPSIEVRGVLHGPRGFDGSKHPVPVTFTEDDIEAAYRGKLVTKVFTLEDPETAIPLPTKPDEPIELGGTTEDEALNEARRRGRPMLIVRLGERAFLRDELAAESVSGTVWKPGTQIPMPVAGPRFPYGMIPLYDPIQGPLATTEECFRDGGDAKTPLGIRTDGALGGLDQGDTAIEYTLSNGKRKVETSNVVCICVPRYVAVRVETTLEGVISLDGPRIDTGLTPPVSLAARKLPGAVREFDGLQAVKARTRPNSIRSTLGLVVLKELNAPQAVAQVQGVKVVAQVYELEEITKYPTCRLTLQKWVEPRFPSEIGEEVEFVLRYTNTSGIVMTDVVVSDSLTGRLEYIEGTGKTDRPAALTVSGNEAGSVALRWAIAGKLSPGESGVIKFKARIR